MSADSILKEIFDLQVCVSAGSKGACKILYAEGDAVYVLYLCGSCVMMTMPENGDMSMPVGVPQPYSDTVPLKQVTVPQNTLPEVALSKDHIVPPDDLFQEDWYFAPVQKSDIGPAGFYYFKNDRRMELRSIQPYKQDSSLFTMLSGLYSVQPAIRTRLASSGIPLENFHPCLYKYITANMPVLAFSAETTILYLAPLMNRASGESDALYHNIVNTLDMKRFLQFEGLDPETQRYKRLKKGKVMKQMLSTPAALKRPAAAAVPKPAPAAPAAVPKPAPAAPAAEPNVAEPSSDEIMKDMNPANTGAINPTPVDPADVPIGTVIVDNQMGNALGVNPAGSPGDSVTVEQYQQEHMAAQPAEEPAKRTRAKKTVATEAFDYKGATEYMASAVPEDISLDDAEAEICALRDLMIVATRRQTNLAKAIRRNAVDNAALKEAQSTIEQLRKILK